MSFGSKKKELRYTCLSEAKASHSHRMWAEVSSSTPHLLHKGLLVSPIKWRCLFKVLGPVRRPVTTLDCVLLKDKSLVCTRTRARNQFLSLSLSTTKTLPPCQMPVFQPAFYLLIFCLETPKDGSGPTNFWTETSVASLSVISFPRTPECPRQHWYVNWTTKRETYFQSDRIVPKYVMQPDWDTVR